ncbi:hypothetical protein [Rhodococcus koreensis]|uniref:hypothetical protein n=1 Tax=Rhodococcus koreensis TaxID=99653 RepID=UPI0036DBBC7E
MTTGVGLTVGDSVSTAVVTASGTDVRTIEHPSVLFTAPDGTVQLGDPGTESTGAVRDFLARVGEPAGIEYAGSLTRAEDLVATAMFCLFREASDGLSGTVKVTATHPSDWAPEIVTKLRESLDYMGLGDATLIPESVALAASPESPAQGAALLAAGLALTDEDTSADTESIPVVEAPLHTAYSAVTAVPAAAAASADASPPAETEASAPTAAAKRPDRRPLIIAGVAAAALVVAGGAVAFALTGKNSTAVPSIQDAQTASVTTSTARPTPVAPAVFPTASTQEVAVTTEVEAPIPVAPPPAPVETTSVFVPPPPPTTTTTTTPVITLPSITTVPQTTTTTTAATTTTTPPETTTTTTTTTKEPLAATTTTTPVLPALKTPGQ